jgi:hypothetical protein
MAVKDDDADLCKARLFRDKYKNLHIVLREVGGQEALLTNGWMLSGWQTSWMANDGCTAICSSTPQSVPPTTGTASNAAGAAAAAAAEDSSASSSAAAAASPSNATVNTKVTASTISHAIYIHMVALLVCILLDQPVSACVAHSD